MPEAFASEGFADTLGIGKRRFSFPRSSLFSENRVASILGLSDGLILLCIGLIAFWGYLGFTSPDVLSYIATLPPMASIAVLFLYFGITFPWNADSRVTKVIQRLRELPVHIYFGCDLIGYHFPGHRKFLLGQVPALKVENAPPSGWSGVLKLLEGKILGKILTIFCPPLMGAIARAIKLTSPGSVLYRQKPYDFHNQLIEVHKFPSMHHSKTSATTFIQATDSDPRQTKVGRSLRKTSLHELPELFDVLNNTVSLIGPQPHSVELDRKFEKLLAGYKRCHEANTGMTGWAQINGSRDETETVDRMRVRVEHDIYHFENRSLWLDVRILFATLFVGWTHKNAY